jgi:hypothetical protein
MTTIYNQVAPPIKNASYTFCIALTSQASPSIFQVNPTLAAGDVKVDIDGGGLDNLATLPSVIEAGKLVSVSLSASEMNGNIITIVFSDAADDEWQDLAIVINTVVAATPTTFPAGAIPFTYTLTDDGDPISGADVWISTDNPATNIIWRGVTNTLGVAKDVNDALPQLDAGTYYVWVTKDGVQADAFPDTEVVS